MNFLEAIFLGLIQGLTEFLPVSSSGHLIVGRSLFGGVESDATLAFDVLLHLVTALVIILYFRKDILKVIKSGFRNWLIILMAIIPAGLVGFFGGDYISEIFRSNTVVAIMLILGSALMAVGEHFNNKNVGKQDDALVPKVKQAFAIGLFQILSLIPGTSRSGSTISAGLIVGLSRVSAARFSFIMGLPLILAAGASKVLSLTGAGLGEINTTVFLWGGIAAFVSGLFAVHILMKIVSQKTLWPFIWYRVALAVVILLFFI